MALTRTEDVFLSRVEALTFALANLYGEATQLNAMYYGGTSNLQNMLVDADIASVPGHQGITHAIVNEDMFLIGQLKALMDARLEQIAATRR